MADTVDTIVTNDGQRNYIVRITGKSDGTGETAVVKVDASSLVGPDGKPGTAPDSFAVDSMEWSIQGYLGIQLDFDATTNNELGFLSGNGERYFDSPLQDPKTSGYTGDILLTSIGAVANGTYDILLRLKKKQ